MSNGEKKRNNGRSVKTGTSSSKAQAGATRQSHFGEKELEKAYDSAVRKFGDNLKRLTD